MSKLEELLIYRQGLLLKIKEVNSSVFTKNKNRKIKKLQHMKNEVEQSILEALDEKS